MTKEFIKPTELPDIETIEEILFEIKDTNLYDLTLNSTPTDLIDANGNINYNSVRYFELGRKLVQYAEMVMDNEYKLSNDPFIPSYARVVEHSYEVNRYVVALTVTARNGDIIKGSSSELYEVIERIKSYLGNDLYDVKYLNSQVFIGMVLSEVKKLSKT